MKATCEHCGRTYRKCRYNVHSQKYCLHEECVRARKQDRQRRSYNKRYREDGAFREAEQERCRQNRRRAAESAPCVEPASSDPPLNWDLVVLGMAGMLTDQTDPTATWDSVRSWEQRGQRLAINQPLARGAPSG